MEKVIKVIIQLKNVSLQLTFVKKKEVCIINVRFIEEDIPP